MQLYISEISGHRWRGLFTALDQLSIVIGIFVSYAVSAIPNATYTHSAVVGSALVFCFVVLILPVIETPRFLMSKGLESEARRALCWLRQSAEIAEEEIVEIKKLTESSPKLSLKMKLREFKKSHVYIPLTLSIGLIFFHQFSGINVIVVYAATIFQTAGISSARETALYAVGAMQIIATVISSITVDFVGRKVLLFIGSTGMALSSAALGAHFFLTRPELCNGTSDFLNITASTVDGTLTCNPQFAPLAITSLVAFIFAFSVGWRTMPFIIMNELFPLRLRGFLGGIGSFFVVTFLGIVTGLYQDFELAVGAYTAWWVFAFVSFVGIFFVLLFLPETKGKTLEEIERRFKSKKAKKTEDRLQTTNPLAIIDERKLTCEINGLETSV